MAPPSPITCRPSAARHPLLLRARARSPRLDGAALGLRRALPPTREPLVATRGIVAAAAEPWSSARVRVWPSRSRREAPPRCAAAGQLAGHTGVARGAGMEVALASTAVVAMGTGNRVLYKLALVPLRNYPFFLAQLATFGCVRTSLAARFARSQH